MSESFDDEVFMDLEGAADLDDLLARIERQAGTAPLPGMWPIFGGPEPGETYNGSDILSWDETRLLIGTWGGNGEDCEIVPRPSMKT